MAGDRNEWTTTLVSGMALLTVGIVALDGAPWFVRYPVLVAALLLSVASAVQAALASSSL
jgi:hypothetical protein